MSKKELVEDDGDDVIIKEEVPSGETITAGDESKNESAEDSRLINDSDDDAADDGKSEAEREAIRERRRKEKVERKERRDQAIGRDKLELDFLRKRNDDLERRMTGLESHNQESQLANVDARLREAVNEISMAEKVIAKAVSSGNGDDVAQAMRYRDQAMIKAQQLKAYAESSRRDSSKPQQEKMDSLTESHAREFLKDNPWYDVQGRDEESAILLAIDQGLVKDGFNPQSEEYWDELRKRGSRRLPERFKNDAARQPRGGPAIGGGREHAPNSTRKEVYISAERKQALIDAGVWDDAVLRQKYVKRYMEYDRNKNI